MHEPKPIRCLIIDDEPPARDVIRRYVEQVPFLELAGECNNAIQALTFLQQEQVELLFMDIRMPQLNGNQFVRSLTNTPKVIFTTAFPDYAIESYDLNAVDYLLKPIPFDRFLKAVTKLVSTPTVKSESIVSPERKAAPFVYFRADRKMIKVMLADIFYVESMKDYVKVFTKDGVIITKQPISSVEEMMPADDFIRVHRSYIVSIRHIKTYTNELIEINKTEIPIGKLYRNTALKQLE